MVKKLFIFGIFAFYVGTAYAQSSEPIINLVSSHAQTKNILSTDTMPLNDRYAIKSVNDVFKDNILLTISYMFDKTNTSKGVQWDNVRKDFSYDLVLQPGEVFAYHDSVLPEFADKKIVTTNAHFSSDEGFESDGYLVGDGVCHLASFMNMTARNAGLKVTAPTNHDFATIPDVPKQYGTAIYYMQGEDAINQMQNLYIENTLTKPVHFVFTYAHDTLTLSIQEEK